MAIGFAFELFKFSELGEFAGGREVSFNSNVHSNPSEDFFNGTLKYSLKSNQANAKHIN